MDAPDHACSLLRIHDGNARIFMPIRAVAVVVRPENDSPVARISTTDRHGSCCLPRIPILSLSTMHTGVITYLRDCYDADNRRTTVWDLFHRSIEHRIVLDGREDLLTGSFARVPVDAEQGIAAQKQAFLSRKEKEYVLSSLLLVGRIDEGEATRVICAPLIMHPAQIVEGEDTHIYIQPDLDERQINYRLLDALRGEGRETSLAPIDDALHQRTIAPEAMGPLISALENLYAGIDCAPLYFYPELHDERSIRALYGRAKESDAIGLTVVPGSIAALIPRSTETRGVTNELTEIAAAPQLSRPLSILVSSEWNEPSRGVTTYKPGPTPAILSNAQRNILRSAATQPLTLVIGPPGTGKSFTIACVALEHMARGESVLIASKMNHAVDVVAAKIEEQLGTAGCVIRAGRKQYLKDLKTYLEDLLSGVISTDEEMERSIGRIEQDLQRADSEIDRLEKEIGDGCVRELKWGSVLASGNDGLFRSIHRRYISWRAPRARPLWEPTREIEQALRRRTMLASELLRSLYRQRISLAVRKHRRQLNAFLSALRARTGSRQEELWGAIDLPILLKAFPVWLTSLSDVHRVLPLQNGMFDVAIIDEATQCDIASSLPILQRARRVVVVGDPNQLRHLSFLARDRQNALADKHDLSPEIARLLNYRDKSLLDLLSEQVARQESVGFLNEHYRSLPSIISFSNRHVYRDSLHVMTERPENEQSAGVVLHRIDGTQERSGVNSVEADAILRDVVRRVEEQRHLALDLTHSIGILSPFREQADYIAAELAKQLPIEAFNRHGLMVGTPFTFQGEERDLMFISLAIDADSHSARYRHVSRRDAFNVAITRARLEQHIYTSLSRVPSNADSLLALYLEELMRDDGVSAMVKPNESDLSDEFLRDVMEEMRRRDVPTWPAFRMAGLTMDIVLLADGRNIGVDLIGSPGRFGEPLPVDRYRMFHRAGLEIIPVPYTRWLLRREECIAMLASATGSSLR